MSSNPKVSIDQLLFRNLYYRYKRFVTPLITIGVCLLLFWLVVMPQIQNWFALREALDADQQALDVMHRNLSLITSLDDAKLDATLTTATSALPTEKDFAGILSSLQNAAAVAGIVLGDYSFTIGDLSGLDKQGNASQLPVQLNVILKGNVSDTQKFIAQLKKQLPLSDATTVAINSNTTVTVTLLFYYNTLPKITFKDTSPLPVLASNDQKLLDSLSQGVMTHIELPVTPSPTVLPTSVATGSAQ